MVLIKDPDTMISSGTATLAEIIGESFRFEVIIILIIAYEVYELIKSIKEDKQYGSCRRSVKRVAKFMITFLFYNVARYIGCMIGCMTGYPIFSTIGSAIGAFLAGFVNWAMLDPILDFFKLDAFENRRYE